MADPPKDDWVAPKDDWQTPGGGSQQPPADDPPYNPVEDFVHGVSSGMAGDIVGAGQLVRHVLPDSLTDWAANSRLGQALEREAERPSQGWAGTAGNIAGAAVPFVAMPGLSAARGWGPAARAMSRSTLPAAVQPVAPNDPHYWDTKALQTAIGTVAGEALHGLASLGARGLSSIRNTQAFKSLSDLAERINKDIRDENTAREAQYRTRRGRVENLNQQIGRRNEAIDQRYDQARLTQQQQTYQQRQAAQAAKAAQDRVPAQTTQNWWRETLTPIGEQARTPTANTPEASAQVRRIVGDRLNTIRGQMRIGRDDADFRTDIDGIRDRIEARLSNDAMRDQWHYEPPQRFTPEGQPIPPTAVEQSRARHSIWNQYVEQPLENLPELSGRNMADYVSRLGDLAEQYARRAMSAPQAERPELEAISQGLRDVVDVVDRRGVTDPELGRQLTAAKRSYMLWSIGNSASDVTGTMTPRNLTRIWMRRQGGPANYGAEMDPTHPRYHHENARLKDQLQQARVAHEIGPPPAPPVAPIPKPTTKWSTIPTPRKPVPIRQGVIAKPPPPPPPSAGATAAKSIGLKLLAGHLAGLPGVILEPAATAAARRLARSPTAAHALSHAGRLGPAAAVGGSQAVTPIPEVVVTAPRYSPGKDQEQK